MSALTAGLQPRLACARVLVVDRRREFATRLRDALPSVDVVHLPRTTHLLATALDEGPWDIVAAGPSEEHFAGLQRLASLRAALPDVGLLVAVNGTQPADLSALVRARPDELVHVPASADVLRAAFSATLESVLQRRGGEAGARDERPLGRVIAVGGPTGGSGKTMVATNAAALLARAGRRVVLVDLDLQFGEVAPALHLRPAATLMDALYDEQDHAVPEAALPDALAAAVTSVPAGFAVLPAPRDPANADDVSPLDAARVLATLRTQYDDIVVDTATGLGDVTLAAIDLAEHLLVVAQVDVPAVANLRTYLATLDRLGVAVDRRRVVLNKDMAGSGLTAEAAAELVGPVSTLPFSAAVVRALNAGRPLHEDAPSDAATRALADALEALVPCAGATPATPHRSRLPWRRRRSA